MVDGGEERGGDGADGFLWPALGLQAEELGSVVAVLGALGGPGTLNEHRLEPRRPLAQARGLALAGAFVLPGAQAGPSDEMAGTLEATHVGTDLGQNCRRSNRTDPGDRAQKSNQVAKGRLAAVYLRFHAADPLTDFDIKLANRLIQTIPLPQMEREQKAVVIRQAPVQGIVKAPSATP